MALLLFFICNYFLGALLAAESNNPLETLRPKHPRLIALDSDLERVRRDIATDPVARKAYESIRKSAAKILAEEPVKYQLIGPRLLDKSRRALARIYDLTFLYRMEGKREYRDRAVAEMKAAAEFPDWNPSHFLDTAEMTHALAIGYDWLYAALSTQEREWIRRAIVEKGLKPSLPIYEQQRWWVAAHHNWNQVCNGGMGIGALAVATEEPELSRRILDYARQSMPRAMASYGPDGGWNEGPGYWHYATRYTVYLLSALETALGNDMELSKAQGFERAGHFRVYFSSPVGETFNYADSAARVGSAPEMFWLARRFDEPAYRQPQREYMQESGRAEPLDLIWMRAPVASPAESHWPLDAVFTGVQVAFLRSSWSDRNAAFVAVKGGDNKANHSHLDLGSFVLDAMGVRWGMDLGSDGYNMPGYFGKQRWSYYRLRTESHNTVLIDGENQDPAAKAAIVEQRFTPEAARVRIDLTAAYASKLERHWRDVELVKRRDVQFTDTIEARQPVEALWGMVTAAEVAVDGRKAKLTLNGKTLHAEVLSPADGRFDVVSTAQAKPQNANTGTRKLVVRLPGKVENVRIQVRFTPE